MTPLFEQPGLSICEGSGLIVILMRASPDDAVFAECGLRVREVATRQRRLNVLIMIPNFDRKPTATRASQAAFAKTLGELREHVVGTCITITVPGLKGAMIRMAVNAVLMLGKLHNPIQIQASVPATVAWLRALPGQVPALLEAPNLLQDLERLLS
jgi:hypothetical protein